MGCLRLFLAIAVVLSHSGGIYGYVMTGGVVAVKAFFIISGFYMALILNEKYKSKEHSLYLFYTNRFFRLVPVYLFFLTLKIFLSIIFKHFNLLSEQATTVYPLFRQSFVIDMFAYYYDKLSIGTIIFIIFDNLTLLGSFFQPFLAIDNSGSLFFYEGPWNLDALAPIHFMFLPQSWTIGFEYGFYLIVPFMVKRRTSLIVTLIIAGFIFRFFLYYLGLKYLPWTDRFFPIELVFFLMGLLSYKIYHAINRLKLANTILIILIVMVTLGLTLFYPILPYRHLTRYFLSYSEMIYFSLFFLGIPFVFYFTKNNRVDRFIGELSYPIYLCHLFVIPFFGAKSAQSTILSVISCVLLSSVVFLYVGKPIEQFRQKRVKQLSKNNQNQNAEPAR